MKKNIALGIDLGTTNTLITVKVEDKDPVTLVSNTGSRLIPSIAYFGKKEIIVGESAVIKLKNDPLNTYYSVKRFIGKYYSDLGKNIFEKYPYIIQFENDETIILKNTNQSKNILPQEVSAQVLLEALALFRSYYKESNFRISKIVITIPAYFNHNQRQATLESAAIAGLDEVELINEPTAAAIAYSNLQGDENNTIVFDLGGGTFDISLVNYDGDDFWSVVASDGDDMLGGDDFDNIIISIINIKCKQLKPNLKFKRNAVYLIKKFAVEFKEKLSEQKSYEIDFPVIANSDGEPFAPTIKITRAEFNRESKLLFKKIEDKIINFLGINKVKNRDINHVVLVGGSSRIPKFREIVEKLTNLKASLNGNFNSDEAVSFGASIYAEMLHQGKVKVSDITPLNLGYGLKDDVFDVVIPMNSKIPLKKTNLYTTIEDFQECVHMQIRQGNRLVASQNPLLGEFILDGLSNNLKGKVNIEGSIIIDQNGILTGEAKDLDTNSYEKIEIKEYMVLTQDQIRFLKSDAIKFLDDDKKYIIKVQLKEKIEKTFENAREYLRKLDIDNSQELIDEIKDIYELSKYHEKSLEELETYISRIEYIYREKSKSEYKDDKDINSINEKSKSEYKDDKDINSINNELIKDPFE